MLDFWFLTAGLFCQTNIQGRPHAEVSCCQLNWNSPCPGDRAGRQWKPAVIKADRVSGKRRNRSAMSLTKVLAWQWEKYKLSIFQTNATQIGTHTHRQMRQNKMPFLTWPWLRTHFHAILCLPSWDIVTSGATVVHVRLYIWLSTIWFAQGNPHCEQHIFIL